MFVLIDKSIQNICSTHIAYFLKFAHHNDVDAFSEFKYKYFKENVVPDLSNFLNQPALDSIEVILMTKILNLFLISLIIIKMLTPQ